MKVNSDYASWHKVRVKLYIAFAEAGEIRSAWKLWKLEGELLTETVNNCYVNGKSSSKIRARLLLPATRMEIIKGDFYSLFQWMEA